MRGLRAVTGRGAAAGTPPRLLLDREVPDVSGVRAVLAQNPFLGWGNDQAVTGHTNTLSTNADVLEEVKRRFLTRLGAGVCTPRL
jgi:hypothetical protein